MQRTLIEIHWLSNKFFSKASPAGTYSLEAEVHYTAFVLKHNLSLGPADRVAKLFPTVFPDSKIAAKFHGGSTKIVHIINCATAADCVV